MTVAIDTTSADERILDATLTVLARDGVAGVSMRAVAREAGVAVGLANYHFDNKTSLISAALRRIGEQDAMLVAPANEGEDPAEHLRQSLRRALDPAFLARDYLSLRLQLWSLAGVDSQFADINRAAQKRYLAGLADLIQAARTELGRTEVEQRAADILIEQNGVWLTAILITDPNAVDRAIDRCNQLAFD
ncbi:MAG: TetR family transcriptional regulator [Acidimicrobiales bacterium]|nr:MAG: TetR family transcriptional regulator [Acidimicrobiales bacterium]